MSRWIVLWTLVASMVAGCVSTPSGPTTSNGEPSATTTTTTTVVAVTDPAPDRGTYRQARAEMVETQIVDRGVTNPLVLEAMRVVPRHEFVPGDLEPLAYGDHPLPIGHGQTISQPYIVAWMSELLEVEPGDRVLEIGTGSGYQAAVLAEMGIEVYTVEIIPELAATAAPRLERLGYVDVDTLQADGYFGWTEHAPYDAIIVTAAPDHVPQPLIPQLGEGANLVIPVGPVGSFQTLWRFTVADSGEILAENLGFVAFVPLTRSES